MKELKEWLENSRADYARGVALYEAHGRSRVVLTALRRGESEFTRQRLRQELTRLAEAPPAPAAAVPPPAPPRPPRPTARPTAPPAAATPPVAPDVRSQRSSWFAERHRLHATLELLDTDDERRVAGERILLLSDYLTRSYHGPAGAAEATAAAATARPLLELRTLTDVGEIRRRLANLRALASKLKKNPARALDLQQAQADIKILEGKLLTP